MKLITDDNKIILYLNKMYIETLDFNDKEATEKYIKHLLTKLSNKYDIKFSGYYVVNLYVDMSYGVIVEAKKEELEYLDYFGNQIEMNTKVAYGSFLYEVSNIDSSVFNNFYVYKLKDRLFLRLKNNLSDIDMGRLVECSNIIYGKEADKIIKRAKLVR